MNGRELLPIEKDLIEAIKDKNDHEKLKEVIEKILAIKAKTAPLLEDVSIKDCIPIPTLDVRDKNHWNMTPLMYAARDDHSVAVYRLIQEGVSIDLTDDHRRTALMIAAERGSLTCLTVLIPEVKKHPLAQMMLDKALMSAAEKGYADCTKTLIEAGANPNCVIVTDNRYVAIANQQTPIFKTVLENHPDCLKILIESGAKVDFEDNTKKTPLMYAVEKHCSEQQPMLDCIKALIKAGADPQKALTAASPSGFSKWWHARECRNLLTDAIEKNKKDHHEQKHSWAGSLFSCHSCHSKKKKEYESLLGEQMMKIKK